MEGNPLDKYFDYVLDNGPWMIAGLIVAAGLLIAGYKLPGVLIAVAGLLAAPQLVGTFDRYGLSADRRKVSILALGTVSFIAFVFSDPNGDAANAGGEPQLARSEAPVAKASSATTEGNFVTNCVATDGDTLRCGNERIRLLGIDAPEMPGSCAAGRECVSGNPYASQESLEAALAFEMEIIRVGKDRFERTLGMVYSGGYNLSCHQLASGQAVYVADWDDGGMVAAECG